MLFRARDELGLDMRDAVFIGDSITDVRAALAASIRAILVLTGLGVEQLRDHYQEANGPFLITMNLKHAVEVILQGLYLRSEAQNAPGYTYSSFFNVSRYLDTETMLSRQLALSTEL